MINPAAQKINNILSDQEVADDDRRGSSSDIAFTFMNKAAPAEMARRATMVKGIEGMFANPHESHKGEAEDEESSKEGWSQYAIAGNLNMP
jgi:hypothetical protein